jgi:hypothetical protein
MKKKGIVAGNSASLFKKLTPEGANGQRAICEIFK